MWKQLQILPSWAPKRLQTVTAAMELKEACIPLLPDQCLDFPGGLDGKESTCNAGDPGSVPGLGRFPGGENCYPLQYSCLENSLDRGAWRATDHGVTRRQTQLNDFTFFLSFEIILGRIGIFSVCSFPIHEYGIFIY